MNVLISIIIPAYNCADVLEKAVNSVIKNISNSNENEIEILIVENGSTDNTTEIAERLEIQYPYIRVLHSSKGVSNARNKGIQEASGTWIVFLDADDEFSGDGIDILLKDAQNEQADICFYGHMNGKEARLICNNEQVYKGTHLDKCKIMMLSNPTWYFTVWAKLIRRTLIVDNGITFNSNLRLAEDGDFLLQCLTKSRCVVLKKEIIYHYIVSGTSTMRSFDGNKIKDYIIAMNESIKVVKNASIEVKEAFSIYILMHLNIAMVRENYSFNNPSSFFEKYKKMCKVIKEPTFEHAIQKTKINQCFSPRMLPILCFKLHFNFGASMIYCIRALQNHLKER